MLHRYVHIKFATVSFTVSLLYFGECGVFRTSTLAERVTLRGGSAYDPADGAVGSKYKIRALLTRKLLYHALCVS